MTTDRRDERGQIIVLFGLALVAMVAMVGLVLDGGSAFAQRREQQNAADLAALAGANAYLVHGDQVVATQAARETAAENGFTHGNPGVTVTVHFNLTTGARVAVDITAPHRNNFAAVVGMPNWDVSTTATALTGIPDRGLAPAPFIFSIDVFGPNGEPLPQFMDPNNPFGFNADNKDVPVNAEDLAWTDFGYDKMCEDPGNVDASTVKSIVDGSKVIDLVVDFGCYIGQHNNGNMTTIYADVEKYMAGKTLSVPVVDDGGNFQGWASFTITAAVGGSDKKIYGYFQSPFRSQTLTVGCPDGNCPRYLGSYVLRLVN